MKKTKKQLEQEIKNLQEQLNTKPEIQIEAYHNEPSVIMAMGSAKVNGFASVKVRMDYLKKAIQVLQDFNKISGKDSDTISITLATNFPVILGTFDKEKSEASGIIIAPIVDD